MRTLQSQIGWTAKAQWAMTAVMLGLGAAFYVLGYRPAVEKIAGQQAEYRAKAQKLQADQSRARLLPSVEADVEVLRQTLERFDKKMPRQQDLGQFIKEITQMSQQAALKKLAVNPGVPRRSDQFSELPITLTFEGDFVNVFEFLRDVEQMKRLTRVRGLTVKNRDPALGQVEVQVGMNIYFSEL